MADNKDNQKTESFDKAKIQKKEEIFEIKVKLQAYWKQYIVKRKALHEYNGKIFVVSDKFAVYNRKQAYLVHAMRVCSETDQQVERLFNRLVQFEGKVVATGKTLNNIRRKLRENTAGMQTALNATEVAKNKEEMEVIPIPSIYWVETAPGANVDELAVEWAEMNLEHQITNFLAELDDVKCVEAEERRM